MNIRDLSLWLSAGLLSPGLAFAADATLAWAQRVELSMPVPGVVAQAPAQPGERVKAGAVLAALDQAPYGAELAAADAAATRRRLERDEAKRDHDQSKELHARTVLSTVDYENAKLKFERAEADLREARALLERARYRHRVSTLRAPFHAVVLTRSVEVGMAVSADLKPPVLFVVASADQMLAVTRVSPEKAAALAPGRAVKVEVAGRSVEGRIQAVRCEGEKDGCAVETVFASSGLALRPGQAVRVDLP